jgi:hypothetical protein
MTAPTMRRDLQPLCPEHLLPMLHCDVLLKWDVDMSIKRCYECGTSGCTYHYDVLEGYFTAGVGERIERDMRYWQECPKDGCAMYISTVEVETDKRTWKCGQVECAGSRVTEGLKSNDASAS